MFRPYTRVRFGYREGYKSEESIVPQVLDEANLRLLGVFEVQATEPSRH